MDGYSVEEAADVLGIPSARVWELIARGVLVGASEGGGSMRVYLRAPGTAAQFPAPASFGEAAEPERRGGGRNGGNGEGHREASPFRELLTEFRSLTERYGQALLALGEARGEVAALRSRVEVLEARMDMRLPFRPSSTVAWEMPDRGPVTPVPPREPPPDPRATAAAGDVADTEEPPPPAPALGEEAEAATSVEGDEAEAVQPAVEAAPPPVEPAEAEKAPGTSKRRASGGRAALAGLAEALARAEDPALADLPGAREAAEALAALRREVEAATVEDEHPSEAEASVQAEPAMPAEAQVEVLASEAPTEPEVPPEPEAPAFAPKLTELTEAELERPPAEPSATPSAPAEPFEAPSAPAEPSAAPSATAPQPLVEPSPIGETEVPQAEAPGEVAPEAPGEVAPAPGEVPPTAPASPYSTDVVEPDWFADGDFTWLDAPAAQEEEPPETGFEPDSARGAHDEAPSGSSAPQTEPDEVEETAEAIQEAFDVPDATHAGEAAPQPEPEEIEETAEAIQEAFEEPDASHPAASQAPPPWPTTDEDVRPRPTAPGGFGLFRGQPDRPISERRVEAAPSHSPAESPRGGGEEAVMWLGDEFDAAELEVATPGWRDEERMATPGTAVDEDAADGSTGSAALELSDAEIDRLAADEGWDQSEVEAIRGFLGREREGGSAPEPAEAAPATQLPSTPLPPPPNTSPETTAFDQDWLRGRRGPAATAYRRLRRLLQG